MSLQYKLTSQSDEFALGLAFYDSILMAFIFWPADLTMPEKDEPALSLEQLLMFTDMSQKVLFCTGRKIAKSIKLETDILRKAITEEVRPGQIVEGLITTPRESQMSILYGRIMSKFLGDPLISATIAKTVGGEKPETWFRNNFVWHWRIEGLGGTDSNMIGIRAKHILGDEQQLGNWVCHDSRKMSALPDCTFLYAGVPNGVRGTPFYALDQTSQGSEWSHHKYPTFINPLYASDENRASLIRDFGDANSFSYQTQVLGEWGDETISSFPPGTIAIVKDVRPFIHEYRSDQISHYAAMNVLGAALKMPSIRCHSYAMGIDHGPVSDPTVIIIATRAHGEAPWVEQYRISLLAVPLPFQADVVKYLVDFVVIGNCVGIATDDIGMADEMIKTFTNTTLASKIFLTNPGGSILLLDDNGAPRLDKNGKPVKMHGKQFCTEQLRKFMVNANLDLPGIKLWLGNDDELVEELVGTTERRTEGGYAVYYSSKKTSSWFPQNQVDHNVDSLRYLAFAIANGLLQGSDTFSEAALIESLGWAGKTPEYGQAWNSPWSFPSL